MSVKIFYYLPMSIEIIKQAERLAGGTTKLGEIAGVTSQCVSAWKRNGEIPLKHVMTIEKALQRKITRYQMRPDVFEIE